MTTEHMTGTPSMTITPLTSGAMIDASAVKDPAKLDLPAIVDAFKTYGAVVITGCDIRHAEFVAVTERLAGSFMEYVGGANNDRDSAYGASKTVLTVTGGSAAKYAIPLHGEMFYTLPRPETLFFCCINPASENGQTTICDGIKFWAALPDEAKELFETKRLAYRRIYNDDAWKKVYKTDSLDHVRALCAKNGVQLTEHEDGTIETLHVCHAYHDVPAGRAFINSVLVWMAREYIEGIQDSKVRFEDGTELPKDLMYKIHAIGESLTQNIDWQPGWLAIVDNMRVMHGRRSYEDGKRDIIMRLSDEALGVTALAAE